MFLIGVSKVLDKVLTCKTAGLIIDLSYELDNIASRHYVSTIFARRPSSKGGDVKRYVGSESDVCSRSISRKGRPARLRYASPGKHIVQYGWPTTRDPFG